MIIRRFIAICFLLVAALPAIAGRQGERTDWIDSAIWLVKAGGLWTKNDREYGSYRVFVKNFGWEHTRSFLYLQWLRYDDDKQQIMVVETIPIPEFNEGDWYNVVDIERKDNTFVIFFTARDREEAQETAVLSPGIPGKYRFVVEQKCNPATTSDRTP